MSEVQTLITEEPPKKEGVPVFLKVLCILSWTWAGLTILVALLMLGSGDFIDIVFNTAIEETKTEEQELLLLYSREIIDYQLIIWLIGFFVSIVSVILMYKLRKIGFYLYSFTHLGMLVAPFLIFPAPSEEVVEAIQIEGGNMSDLIFKGVFVVGFIVLYGIHLKYMKK